MHLKRHRSRSLGILLAVILLCGMLPMDGMAAGLLPQTDGGISGRETWCSVSDGDSLSGMGNQDSVSGSDSLPDKENSDSVSDAGGLSGEVTENSVSVNNIMLRAAAGEASESDFDWGWSAGQDGVREAYITKYKGTDSEVVIPQQLGGYPVLRIESGAFAGNTEVTSVTMLSVDAIARGAFTGCSSLKTVNMGCIREISATAFEECPALESVTMDRTAPLTRIEDKTFMGCEALKSITFPNGLCYIGSQAFRGCTALKSIDIYGGGSYMTISQLAFMDCTSLESVSLPESLTSLGDRVFCGCTSLYSITIPGNVEGIAMWTFKDCASLTSVSLGEGIQTIGWGAFENCESLVQIDLPSSLENIDQSAFSNCKRLESVDIPEHVESIGDSAFGYCESLKAIIFPNSVKNLGREVLINCTSLVSAKLPDGLEEVPYMACYNCKDLASIQVPEGVSVLGENAFGGCESLSSVELPDSVEEIKRSAFSGCKSLQTVVIPEHVTTIGGYVFSNCGLTAIEIPGSVETIEVSAFSSCRSLTSLVVLDGVRTIGKSAFDFCEALTTVEIADSVETIGENAFRYAPLKSIAIPEGLDVSNTNIRNTANRIVFKDDGEGNAIVTGITLGTGQKEAVIHDRIAGKPVLMVESQFRDIVSETEHTHKGEGEVCTVASSCVICSSEVPPTGHSYGGWAKVSDTLYNRTCPVCQEEDSATINYSPEEVTMGYGWQESQILTVEISGAEADCQWSVDGRIIEGVEDFHLSLPEGLNAGVYVYRCVVTLAGSDDSSDFATTVRVEPASLEGAVIALEGIRGLTYDGSEKKPAVTVSLDGSELAADRDYLAVYSDNVSAGTATVTVTGTGNYEGTIRDDYQIARATPGILWSVDTQELIYTGSEAAVTAPIVTLAGGDSFSGTIYYFHAAEGSDDYMPGLPVEAGTYVLKAGIEATDNYNAAESGNVLTLTIVEKPDESTEPGEEEKPGGAAEPGEEEKPGDAAGSGEGEKPGDAAGSGEGEKPGNAIGSGSVEKPGDGAGSGNVVDLDASAASGNMAGLKKPVKSGCASDTGNSEGMERAEKPGSFTNSEDTGEEDKKADLNHGTGENPIAGGSDGENQGSGKEDGITSDFDEGAETSGEMAGAASASGDLQTGQRGWIVFGTVLAVVAVLGGILIVLLKKKKEEEV